MMKHCCIAVLLAATACSGPPAEGPEYGAAADLLEDVRGRTMDLSYEDSQYGPVLAAFEQVPENDVNRTRAEHWIALIREAQARAADRRTELKAEAARVDEPAGEFRARISAAAAQRARQAADQPTSGGVQPLPSGVAIRRAGQIAAADRALLQARELLERARSSSCPGEKRRLGQYEARVHSALRAREELQSAPLPTASSGRLAQ